MKINRRQFLSGALGYTFAASAPLVLADNQASGPRPADSLSGSAKATRTIPRLPAVSVASLDAQTTQKLRAAAMVQPDTLAQIKKAVDRGLVVTRENDAKETRVLHVVIDPRCPYCAQHFSNLRLLANRPTIHYVLGSVSGSASLRLGAAILSQPNPLQALTVALETLLDTGKPFAYSELTANETEAAKYFSALKEQNAQLLNTGVTRVPFTVYQADSYAVKRELVLDPRQIDVFYQYGDVQGYFKALEKSKKS